MTFALTVKPSTVTKDLRLSLVDFGIDILRIERLDDNTINISVPDTQADLLTTFFDDCGYSESDYILV